MRLLLVEGRREFLAQNKENKSADDSSSALVVE